MMYSILWEMWSQWEYLGVLIAAGVYWINNMALNNSLSGVQWSGNGAMSATSDSCMNPAVTLNISLLGHAPTRQDTTAGWWCASIVIDYYHFREW